MLTLRARLVAAVATALLLVQIAWCWREWCDDAYITFRYTRNLVEGVGFLWNPGERFEGITNLLWGLLLAPAVGGDILLAAKVLGVGCTLATVALLVRWSHAEGLGAVGTAASLAPLVLLPWAPHYAVQGMETPGVLLCVTLAWTRFGRDRSVPWSALGAALAPLLRPDAALMPALLIAGRALELYRRRERPTRVDLAGLALVAGVAAVTVVGKLAWFGQLIPNTFYVKKAPFPYPTGWAYAGNFLFAHSPLFGALALGATLALLLQATSFRERLPAWVFLGYGLAVAVWTGGDFFQNYRFLVPALPAIGGTAALAFRGRGRLGPLVSAAFVVACALTLPLQHVSGAQNPPSLPGFSGTLFWKGPFPVTSDPAYAAAWQGGNGFPAAIILTHVPDGVTVAYTDIGLPGYINDQDIVDIYGLTDAVMAGRGGEDMPTRVAYALDRCGVIVIRTNAPQELVVRLRKGVAADPRFQLVMNLGHHEVYAKPAAWVVVPEPVLNARLARMLELTPRMTALHRQALELAGLTGAHIDLAPFRALNERIAEKVPGMGRFFAEGYCWAADACEGLPDPVWYTADASKFTYVPPVGVDPASIATYLARLEAKRSVAAALPAEPVAAGPTLLCGRCNEAMRETAVDGMTVHACPKCGAVLVDAPDWARLRQARAGGLTAWLAWLGI